MWCLSWVFVDQRLLFKPRNKGCLGPLGCPHWVPSTALMGGRRPWVWSWPPTPAGRLQRTWAVRWNGVELGCILGAQNRYCYTIWNEYHIIWMQIETLALIVRLWLLCVICSFVTIVIWACGSVFRWGYLQNGHEFVGNLLYPSLSWFSDMPHMCQYIDVNIYWNN